MTKIISVVGWHNSGKTTFVIALMRALKALGYRVAVIKHSRGDFDMDKPGTDTWRFGEAGADAYAIVGRDRLAMIEALVEKPSLEELVARVADRVDLVIAEGFKQDAAPKFEVRHGGVDGERIVCGAELLALVGDDPALALPGERFIRVGDIESVMEILQTRGIIDTERIRNRE